MGRADAQPPRARGDRGPRRSPTSPSRRSTAWRSRWSTATACSSAAPRAATARSARTSPTTCARSPSIPLRIERRAAAARGPRRGLHVAAGLRRAQRAPRRAGPVDVHEPAQLRRGDDPPARPQAGRRAPAVDVVLRHRRDRGPRVRRPLGGARVAARARLPRQRRHQAARHRGRGRRAAACAGRSAAARWTSRSTASSSRSTTSSCSGAWASSGATRAGRSRGSSRRRPRSRTCTAIAVERRQVRRPAPVRGARAGPRRRRHGQARDAAQRGGPRAQGHPRGRRGDRPARRRRDPAGRLAGAARRRAARPLAARPRRRRTARRCGTPTVKAEGVFTKLPEPRLPGAPLAAAQALRRRRRDGHRRAGREAGRARCRRPGWSRPPADFYRLTDEQLLELDGVGEVSAQHLLDAIEASRERPFGARAVRASASRASATSPAATSRSSSATIDALLAATRRGDRRDAGHRPEGGRADRRASSPTTQMRALIDDLRAVGCASRRRAPPPGEGPLAGRTLRAHRHAARPDARAGDRADPRRGRPGHGVGVEEDRLRRRRRARRAPSSRRPSGSACRCSTRPGCWRCSPATR